MEFIRIEALRESDPDIDALVTDLKHELSMGGDSPVSKTGTKPHASVSLGRCDLQVLADLIADRVYERVGRRMPDPENALSDDSVAGCQRRNKRTAVCPVL